MSIIRGHVTLTYCIQQSKMIIRGQVTLSYSIQQSKLILCSQVTLTYCIQQSKIIIIHGHVTLIVSPRADLEIINS